MTISKVDVASQALARLGEPAISSFEEDTQTAEKVNQLYEQTVLSALSLYDWDFATVRASLVEDGAATPVNQWTRAFLLPTLRTERVGEPLAVYNSADLNAPQFFGYELQERWLLTDATTIVVKYIQRAAEQYWPGYFQAFVVEALAAVLALPITENASKETLHRQTAYGSPSEMGRGGLLRAATEADSRGDPTRSLLDDHDPIWAARFGGYR